MSGVSKAVGKVFRSVGRAVQKIAIPLLAAAAIVATGGAALGLAPFAGGFGAAVSGALGAAGIGATSTVGSILTGAVTQAGYGAAIGGAIGAATGQGFEKGATIGAIGGALTGGFGAALSGPATAASPVTMGSMNAPAGIQAPAQAAVNVANGAAPAAASAAPAVATAPGTGFGSALSKFASSQGGSTIIGNTISGLGQGLLTGMAAKDQDEAVLKLERKQSANYDGMGPQEYADDSTSDARPTPAAAYARPSYHYDRKQRRVVFG